MTTTTITTTTTRTIRVRHENAEALTAALRAAGFTAEYLGAGSAKVTLDNGCSDPSCPWCNHHEAMYAPQNWGSLRTNATGGQAHRAWLAAGLV